MATTNFSQWNNAAINQETDAQYAVDSLRTGGAPTGGILPSPTFNKFAYQASTFYTAFAEMLANKGFSTSDADIGVLSAVLANILTSADQPNPLKLVPYSPTPALDATGVAAFYMPLNGNSAIQSITGLTAGQRIMMVYAQDSVGGRTVSFPANWDNGSTPDPAVGNVSVQQFIYNSYDGQLQAAGPLTNNKTILLDTVKAITLAASGSLSVGGNASVGSLQIAGGAPNGQVLVGDGTHFVPSAPAKPAVVMNIVTGSRSFGATFTNSTGAPMTVSVILGRNSGSSGDTRLDGFVSGQTVASNTTTTTLTGGTAGVNFIVPAGSTYSANATGIGGSPSFFLQQWTEWTYV